MIREDHVRFCEGPRVELPRPTHPYIPTDEGWLYLAGVKDLFNGELVGYALDGGMTQNLLMQALFRAAAAKRPGKGLIHHSDRGSQGGFNRSSQHHPLFTAPQGTRARFLRASSNRASCVAECSSHGQQHQVRGQSAG